MTQEQAINPIANISGTNPSDLFKSKMIKDFKFVLPEVGKIKIGNKKPKQPGKNWQMPQKLDHFLITHSDRGDDGNYKINKELTELIQSETDQKKMTRIPIHLPFDDITLNFMTEYTCYQGKKKVAYGDGENFFALINGAWTSIDRPTAQLAPEYEGNDKWKKNGVLSVIIRNAPVVGGVWIFRTTGETSISELYSSMALIAMQTNGRLQGIPLDLVMSAKESKHGVYYSIRIEAACTAEALQEKVLSIASVSSKNQLQLKQIEDQARISYSIDSIDDDDVGAEFFSENDPENPANQNLDLGENEGEVVVEEENSDEGLGDGEQLDKETGEVTSEEENETPDFAKKAVPMLKSYLDGFNIKYRANITKPKLVSLCEQAYRGDEVAAEEEPAEDIKQEEAPKQEAPESKQESEQEPEPEITPNEVQKAEGVPQTDDVNFTDGW